MDELTVVIPFREDKDALLRTLDSVGDCPVVVVDDGNEDRLRLRRKGVKVVRLDERGYFSGAVNAGIQACRGDVLVLNQDVQICNPDWRSRLEELSRDYALAGDGVMNHPSFPNGYVQGTYMFMRRDALDDVGLLDARHWPLWGATAEWQLRAQRKGYRVYPLDASDTIKHERQKGQAFGSSIKRLLDEQPDKLNWFIRTPPLVSVVVPVFNYGRFLGELLDSLMAQTFQGFEVIFCDDCSSDNSWEIIKGLVDESKLIYGYRRDTNGGTAGALNTAIRQARGRYIMTMDADDMLASECLEEMIKWLELSNGKGLIYSNQRVWRDGQLQEHLELADYDFDKLLQRNRVPAGTMFSKAAWQEVGGYPEEFRDGRQDWAFAVAMGEKGHCGYRVPKDLYYYRREGQNRSLNSNREMFLPLMQRRFAHLYRGERPMGCCGRKSNVTIAQAATKSVELKAPGTEGFVLLEYVGDNVGRHTFVGAVTGTRYTVKVSRTRFYADVRDVPYLLNVVEGQKYVIRQVSAEGGLEKA